MSSRVPAHRGYQYQDMVTAFFSVGLLEGASTQIQADEADTATDKFDDITVYPMSGPIIKIQTKFCNDIYQKLPQRALLTDQMKLKIDDLFQSAIDSREMHLTRDIDFRVLFTHQPPVIDAHESVLVEVSEDVPSVISGAQSRRFRLKSDEILEEQECADPGSFGQLIAKAIVDRGFSESDVRWVSERLTLEFACPRISGSLYSPGAFEDLILERLSELQLGEFPNHLHPRDVASTLIVAAMSARSRYVALTRDYIFKEARIRGDYGALPEPNLINPALEVERSSCIELLISEIEASAQDSLPLLIEAGPGQGKSWTCERLIDRLRGDEWHVAFHSCFVNSGDSIVSDRVTLEHLLGTLMHSFRKLLESRVTTQETTGFAVSVEQLQGLLTRARATVADTRFAIIIDGLDHVDRAAGRSGLTSSVEEIIVALDQLELPSNTVLIIVSQPLDELKQLKNGLSRSCSLPPWTVDEVDALVTLNGLSDGSDGRPWEVPLSDLVFERAAGNPLYTQYICAELSASSINVEDRRSRLELIPEYSVSLGQYYDYLISGSSNVLAIAKLLAVLDFPISDSELMDMAPLIHDSVEHSISKLAPILTRNKETGRFRYHHESFSRWMTESISSTQMEATFKLVANWLGEKGLFNDERAFRCLIPAHLKANNYNTVKGLITTDFVGEAISNGMPSSEIIENLAVAIEVAAYQMDWPFVTRCTQLSYAAKTYEYDNLGSEVVDFVDVAANAVGSRVFSDRLLTDGKAALPIAEGLKLCEELDRLGFNAPWIQYLDLFDREISRDGSTLSAGIDTSLASAVNRGRLRMSVNASPLSQYQINDERLIGFLLNEDFSSERMAETLLDTLTWSWIKPRLPELVGRSGFFWELVRLAYRRKLIGYEQTIHLLKGVSAPDYSFSEALDLFRFGVPYRSLRKGNVDNLFAETTSMTKEIQLTRPSKELLEKWLLAVNFAVQYAPEQLTHIEFLIVGDSWFRDWLKFSVRMSGADLQPEDLKSGYARDALAILTHNPGAFKGSPRAVDLYEFRGPIKKEIDRAISLLDDNDWRTGISHLINMTSGVGAWLDGDFSAPYQTAALLDSIVRSGSTMTRAGTAFEFISEIEDLMVGQTYYATLARFNFYRSRLHARLGQHEHALIEWKTGCKLLAGYGWHKEISIYDLVDPLIELNSMDGTRARSALARVQPLITRVLIHTDKREVRGAESGWLESLAVADPAELAIRISTWSTQHRGFAVDRADRSLEYLWENHYQNLDPISALLARITTASPSNDHDAMFISSIADGVDVSAPILAWLSSRYDEIAEDDSQSWGRVEKGSLKSIADQFASLGIPFRCDWPPESEVATVPPNSAEFSLTDITSIHDLLGTIRALRRTDDLDSDSTNSLADAIASLLAEMSRDNSSSRITLAIRKIAELEEFKIESLLINGVANKLEMLGLQHLASQLLVNRWAHCRGGGGYLRLGGKTDIQSLQTATALDGSIVVRELSDTLRRMTLQYNQGITQALIFALCENALPLDGGSNHIDAAFECWNESIAVLEQRLPRLSEADDHIEPYTPYAENQELNLNASIILAVISRVTHPLRDQKRLVLLSFAEYLVHFPQDTGNALNILLPNLEDPLDLMSILGCIKVSHVRESVVRRIHPALSELSLSRFIGVAQLARDLAGENAQPWTLPQDAPPIQSGSIISNSSLELASTETAIGQRLKRIGVSYPALVDEIVSRTRDQYAHRDFRQRMHEQIEGAQPFHSNEHSVRWALDEVAEASLQTACADVKSLYWRKGLGTISDSEVTSIAHDAILMPDLPLDLERLRTTRPQIPTIPNPSSDYWRPLKTSTEKSAHSHGGKEVLRFSDYSLILESIPIETIPLFRFGAATSWSIIGFCETEIFVEDKLRGEAYTIEHYGGIIGERSGERTTMISPPVTFDRVAPHDWNEDKQPEDGYSSHQSIALRLDLQFEAGSDHGHGLGLPFALMSPTQWLRDELGLRPSGGYSMSDEHGEAVKLAIWRKGLVQRTYGLPFGRMNGVGILLRQDLLGHLAISLGGSTVVERVITIPKIIESKLGS